VADRLIRLLHARRQEDACAAALVLGALRPRDPRVGPALATRLRTARSPIRPYLREALARQRTDGALPLLARGLLAGGIEREQCRRLIAEFGARALRHMEAALAARPDAPGDGVFVAAAGMRTGAAAAWLADRLGEAPPARASSLAGVLAPEAVRAWPRLVRAALRRRVAMLVRRGRFASAEAIRIAFRILAHVAP
jgi:hypothetical protein